MTSPLVSCIMPTRNRRRFAEQAVDYFLRQDYERRELVVVDDGEDGLEDVIPRDARIQYHRLPKRQPIGAKRNLACGAARGELIAHWDDDDWMATNRLTAQVSHLLGTGAAASGMRELLHYRLEAGEAWLYRAPCDTAPVVVGGTLVYHRRAWEAHPFRDIDVGEDSAFVRALPAADVLATTELSVYIALIHRGNTAGKNLAARCWERRPLDDVSRLLASDREFYAQLRCGESWRPRPTARTNVFLAAQFNVATGYGLMSEYLGRGLARLGADVHVVPLSLDKAGLSDEFLSLPATSMPATDEPTIYFSWPRHELDRFRRCRELFINTMWESNRLPAGWAHALNRARALIVPSRFVAETCRQSGVTVPIAVIPEGIDPDMYYYIDRGDRPGLTTLIVGPVDERKNAATGIAAWKAAFAGDPDARLVIKTQYNYQNYSPDDPRIQYVDCLETSRGIAHWYRDADVLLALGNEGFGLPLVEGMATGLPVVALAAEGQADVCEAAAERVLSVPPASVQPFNPAGFGASGHRSVPSIDSVIARLRWVATHRSEARALGQAASEWALAHRSIWSKAPAVLDFMEHHVQPGRSLQRGRTMWAPTWERSCGIAEYTRDLCAYLQGVAVTASQPDIARTRLVHLQYQPGTVADTQVTDLIAAARRRGVPAVVTTHMVGRVVQPWERDATALVATTDAAAARLRERWPAKRVEHIAHGCPPWSPALKRKRGRVIGAFGFMETHKGFFALLDVVRARPGTELMLFSHPRSPETEGRWHAAATGVTVQRVTEYLPTREIAQRLALEADVLVFWYDEVPDLTSSYAVRIGLATGVPVLTSRTRWFADLADVTSQPAALGDGVDELLDDTRLRQRLSDAAHDYCVAHTWSNVAALHSALWRSLERT